MSKYKNSSKGRSRRRNDSLFTNPLFVILGGLILVAVALFVMWRAKQPVVTELPPENVEVSGMPSLKVDKEKVDLGDVPLDQPVTVTFELSNIGDEPLRFTKEPYIEVKEGCWPPTPTIGSMVLNPGEQTTLSMSFMMHAGMEGMHDFRVHIPNNDPAQENKELVVLSNWVQ